MIVDSAIKLYDEDKIGLADYALHSAGILDLFIIRLYFKCIQDERKFDYPIFFCMLRCKDNINRKYQAVLKCGRKAFSFAGDHDSGKN